MTVQLRLGNVRDAEAFANAIKDALTGRLETERFSRIRLTGAPLRYNDFLDEGKGLLRGTRGITRANGEIEVKQVNDAWQLAGTVIHEMAHVLVGNQQNHNENWMDGARALGLHFVQAAGQQYIPEHFDERARAIVASAIEEFCRENPKLVYDPDIEIPLPEWVGTYECSDFDSLSGNRCKRHRMHILKFQIDGAREMLARDPEKGILLADEMGLGKTVEVMLLINALAPKRILIGCPNNAKLIWSKHFEDYCVHKYDIEVAYSNFYRFGPVVIMNYEALAKWGDALARQEWDLVVYDEGHYLKTPSTKRAKAAFRIVGKKTIIVTGTPIVNYPYELFPLIHYLDRESWPEYGHFEAQFGSRTSDKLGRNLNRLNAQLRATIMTRRLKKDVLTELPRKRRQVVEFEVSAELRKLLDEEMAMFKKVSGESSIDVVNMLNSLKNEGAVAGDDLDWAAIIEELTLSRKFAFEEMARLAHKIGLAKLPFVMEHIENALDAREKVVVFGHHRDVLSEIAKRFSSSSVLLLGGNRDQGFATAEAAERFNEQENCRVFVGQVSIAQGYSIKGSSTVIFVEEDWVPGVMTQAEDRCHGIGRGDADARSMLIQHLVFEDSLDTYKAKLTIKKQKSIDRAVGNLR